MNNKPLYQLTGEFLAVEGMLSNPDYDKQAALQVIESIKTDFEVKVENIGKLVLSNKASIAGIDAEIDRLTNRKKALENTNEWLKSYLVTEMTTIGTTNIKTDILTVYVSTAQKSVEIENLDIIPIEFCNIIPETRVANKTLIRNHSLETGEIIPGTRILDGKKYVVIK